MKIMNKNIIVFVVLLFLMPALLMGRAQPAEVRGTVTDVHGETMPGVTVRLEGTTLGAVTNLDGQYSLRIPSDHADPVLLFTYIGYGEQRIIVGQESRIDVSLEQEMIGLQEVMVVSSFARDRQTPVAISNISAEAITERLGTQEFPQILQSTPSVYATREAGGFGDGRINMRGFDSNNIGVLINGVPVNDMENGRVYWSNWAGLSDVTQTMQVQRGLGASRLAISSVGGTINIITQSTEARQGGSILYGIGHDGYRQKSLSFSTGLLDNGWAVTALGGLRTGEGFVDGLDFEGWSYFVNISKRINRNHSLSFTAFGAPQWHNQRWPRQRIQTYRDHPSGIRYNPSLGILNGEKFTASYNEYHKPQISLNHYWSITPATTLSTAAYVSISSGGGRRTLGPDSGWLQYNRDTGLPTDQTKLTPDGYLDFDAVVAENALSLTGSRAIVGRAVNEHDWYGILSTLQTEYGNYTFTGGADLRYYRGYHYQDITNLLGGSHYQDFNNINRDRSERLREGDKIGYHDLGEVAWAGIFGQAEYTTDDYSAFVSASLSNTSYRRTDYFLYYDDDSPTRLALQEEADGYKAQAENALDQGDEEQYNEYMSLYYDIVNRRAMTPQRGEWQNFLAWSLKGGANYNITDYHNVFANIGYFTRAPFFRFAYVGFTNVPNIGVQHERVFSTEVGYGLRTTVIAANVILYRTEWLDKALVRNLGQGVIANITGLDALHQGIEVDFTFRPNPKIEVRGMFSIGDWHWQDDLIAEIYDENQVFIDSIEVYAGGLKVGNSAQTTAAIGISYEVLPNLRLSIDGNHFDRLFADFNVEDRGDLDTRGTDSWQMPSYQLFDVGLRYRFKIAGLNATLIGNINNVFNTEAIRDATDGRSFDHNTALVYYGWGRSWTTSLRVRF